MINDKCSMINVFKNGSVWLKADFHLHTKADKEFKYNGDENYFVRDYVEQLKKVDIVTGIITNHNKFDKDEFVELKRNALKHNIWLVPGVEFSLKEGFHILIAFEEKWYQGHESNIQNFISSAFYGISNYDSPPYPNSNSTLKDTVEALDKIGYDYFIALAHPDADNGLFKVLTGRTLEAFIKEDSFKKIIAIQKSGNKDNYEHICNLTNRRIACVEGTDNAGEGINSIGKGRITYIKLGDFNFEALKYALIDNDNRIRPKEKPEINNAFIKCISFEGGLLDGKEIHFSSELNNFIGIRGSGKSSIIEIVRYTLGITLGRQASDREYKNDLIEYVLKSGGKVITTVVNEHKMEHRIEKIYGQKEDIYDRRGIRVEASIDTVFKTPVYFGQKDLSNKHIDFEADLVKKLIGNKLESIKSEIAKKIVAIEDTIIASKKLDNLDELKKEIAGSIKDAEYKLKLYKEKGVEDKLRQQSRFDSDVRLFNESLNEVSKLKDELEAVINNFLPFFNQTTFNSEENKDIFLEAEKIFKQLAIEFNKLSDIKTETEKHEAAFKELYKKLQEKKESLKEEFAKIKREIALPNLNPDEFLKLNRQIETSKLKLVEIEKSEKKKIEYQTSLNNKVSELNNLWHEEYKILGKEVSRIDEYENSLSISVEYKGRKDNFDAKLKEIFKGTGIRGATYDSITSQYKDFIEIYRDIENLNSSLNISENLLAEYKKRFYENLFDLLTFRVEDKFTIKYNDKPLKDHSLGQRATALILFLLAQKETDVLIIDQPEDDLDNQTIYEDVIKAIKVLKGKMQFIFATHNANIPVLGDSEKIISCKYSESKIEVHGGTIDSHDTQKQIVTIMEGGEEAFNRRKNIYELWSLKK
ncbi:MAG: histidinol-phosphatase [Deltaproteobacteria bacterium CG12_big_fil_rev_8_21_14_0_65_43_10]|nr:MAG: histidinol-phosphatase [Deltaproteobacteria bacterium CG12_big_fil_rev_8_21_14_0_65_43_10]PIU86504.1 MAG: histidinol-phosphatase [Deltaproteobacteria bacterium CG06_land_8_20_14_3_00_44_19]PIX26749.1 MAG: histidinol-phosphatase [Deltaproteobacteria bacterium CG_4_8_14_3_um_filter_43_13]PIZ19231.1 MAG: histidinol-phosphatase [Deltaproteobacteria bacterium CG_4_10_14_0_8_um_filter_43_12]